MAKKEAIGTEPSDLDPLHEDFDAAGLDGTKLDFRNDAHREHAKVLLELKRSGVDVTALTLFSRAKKAKQAWEKLQQETESTHLVLASVLQ